MDIKELTAELAVYGYTELSQIAEAYPSWVGTDVWGKECKIHFFASSIRIEEYPPGGKIRGKQARMLSISWYDTEETFRASAEIVKQISKDAKTQSYDNVVKTIKTMVAKYAKDSISLDIHEGKQKAINAPNPVAEGKTPKNRVNKKNVKIIFEAQQRQITLKDLTDTFNEPTAFTTSPSGYNIALKTFGDWEELDFRGILHVWNTNKVKYHDYLAMD